jgi:hypothetical protein
LSRVHDGPFTVHGGLRIVRGYSRGRPILNRQGVQIQHF